MLFDDHIHVMITTVQWGRSRICQLSFEKHVNISFNVIQLGCQHCWTSFPWPLNWTSKVVVAFKWLIVPSCWITGNLFWFFFYFDFVFLLIFLQSKKKKKWWGSPWRETNVTFEAGNEVGIHRGGEMCNLLFLSLYQAKYNMKLHIHIQCNGLKREIFHGWDKRVMNVFSISANEPCSCL